MKLYLLFLAVLPLAAQTPLTLEQSLKTRDLSELRFSPDGKRVAFTVREAPNGRATPRHIWVYDTTLGEARQWTFSTKSEHEPRWSPDGKSLAFLSDRPLPSDRNEETQIWLMPADGGEAIELTNAKNSVQTLRWSPDGKRIVYSAGDPKTASDEKKTKEFDDAKVIDVDNKPPHLWTVDIATKAVQQHTKAPWAVREFEWMPDGKRLLLVATERPAVDAHTNRIFLLGLSDGRMDEVLAPKGPFRGIRVSPNGNSFAFVGARVDGPNAPDLFVCPLDTRTPRNLTGASHDRPVTEYEWMNDSEFAVLFENGFHRELDAIGKTTRKLITDDSTEPYSFTRSIRGSIAYAAGTAASLPELWIDGKKVTRLNREFDSVRLYKPELFQYKSFDGMPIEAALYRPEGSQDGKPGALVVLIHGGPTGVWSNRFDPLTQLLVGRGYTVMQPNIRGSIGYGQKFVESNRGDWGGGDFKDMLAGVDELIRRKVADAARLGIGGWSYGGYMAEWAITQTDRFKAAVSGAGMADLAAEFGTEASPVGDEWFYGTPYENLAAFQKSSPITYIKHAKTPTLILQGEADTTDPLSQSQILYRGLKRYNSPAEFVVYPREPHGLREEKHILDRYTRTLNWFDKYIK
jgi:dipeptidyl aminopeptidase/acylaminoacyl peptidase